MVGTACYQIAEQRELSRRRISAPRSQQSVAPVSREIQIRPRGLIDAIGDCYAGGESGNGASQARSAVPAWVGVSPSRCLSIGTISVRVGVQMDHSTEVFKCPGLRRQHFSDLSPVARNVTRALRGQRSEAPCLCTIATAERQQGNTLLRVVDWNEPSGAPVPTLVLAISEKAVRSTNASTASDQQLDRGHRTRWRRRRSRVENLLSPLRSSSGEVAVLAGASRSRSCSLSRPRDICWLDPSLSAEQCG